MGTSSQELGFRRVVQKIKLVRELLSKKIDSGVIGAPYGVAPLGADGKVPANYLKGSISAFSTLVLGQTYPLSNRVFQLADGDTYTPFFSLGSGVSSSITVPYGVKLTWGPRSTGGPTLVGNSHPITVNGGGALYLSGDIAGTVTASFTNNGCSVGGTGLINVPYVLNGGAAHLFGGLGEGDAGSLKIYPTLTLTAGHIDVYTDGISLSRIVMGSGPTPSGTINVNGACYVHLLQPMPAGTFTVIATLAATLPTTLPTIGANASGRTASLAWTAGKGLTVTL
uniref:hypothetical protein n=1 Tax=Limnohabitans sp. TaxID=1907725 RepID=UPI00286EE1C3